MYCIARLAIWFSLSVLATESYGQGRPPEIIAPAPEPEEVGHQSKENGSSDPDIMVSGSPLRGETCEVSLAASSRENGPVVVSGWISEMARGVDLPLPKMEG